MATWRIITLATLGVLLLVVGIRAYLWKKNEPERRRQEIEQREQERMAWVEAHPCPPLPVLTQEDCVGRRNLACCGCGYVQPPEDYLYCGGCGGSTLVETDEPTDEEKRQWEAD